MPHLVDDQLLDTPYRNQVFNGWRIISEISTVLGKQQRYFFICLCLNCGTVKRVNKYTVLSGESKSCGCVLYCKHGASSKFVLRSDEETRGLKRTYSSWLSMKARCFNTHNVAYHNYGGRGITVCARWKDSFDNFLEDMGVRPEGTTIDRIDNDGDYEVGNCRWATPEDQARNRRTNVELRDATGNVKIIKDWSDELGVSNSGLKKRIDSGMPVEEALTSDRFDNRLVSYADMQFTYKGKTKTLKDWAYDLNMPYNTLKSRASRGIVGDELFSPEDRKRGPNKGSVKPEGSGRKMESGGNKYGYMLVLNTYRKLSGKSTVTMAKCRCDCGVEKEVSLNNLRTGKVVSCGCKKAARIGELRKAKYSASPGDIFGRLTVLDIYSEEGITKALCRCSCGIEKVFDLGNIKRGNTISCGCANKERMSTNNPGQFRDQRT